MRKSSIQYFCDFCGKSSTDNEVLVAAPSGAAICVACVEIAQNLIGRWRQDHGRPLGAGCPHCAGHQSGLEQSPLDVLLS